MDTPGKPNIRKPFATIPMPGATVQTKPASIHRQRWNNWILRPLVGLLMGRDLPKYNEEGYLDDQKLMELIETLPPEVSGPLNDMVEHISAQMGDITGPMPDLTFEELKNFLPEGLLPSPENLSSMVPSLAQSNFAPIAQEAQRRFSQETVPGIMSQLTGLGQNAGSSAFAGSIGQAGSELQSKLAALESQHNLEQGRLQLGQGELGKGLYHAASQRAGLLGGLQNDRDRLGLSRASDLGRLQTGAQQNQLTRSGQLLNAMSGQQNRPTTAYQPPKPENAFADTGQEIMSTMKKALEAAINVGMI